MEGHGRKGDPVKAEDPGWPGETARLAALGGPCSILRSPDLFTPDPPGRRE